MDHKRGASCRLLAKNPDYASLTPVGTGKMGRAAPKKQTVHPLKRSGPERSSPNRARCSAWRKSSQHCARQKKQPVRVRGEKVKNGTAGKVAVKFGGTCLPFLTSVPCVFSHYFLQLTENIAGWKTPSVTRLTKNSLPLQLLRTCGTLYM